MKKTSLFEYNEKYPILPSYTLETSMKETIEPFLQACAKPFVLTGKEGNPISGTIYQLEQAKGSILISHGFTESQKKYREMIYYFLQEGYNVCIHDHRNHGHSRLEVKPATHVDNFTDYIKDIDQVVQEKFQTLPRPYYLYCHSMGGLIGATYLVEHPEVFEKAVLSSPLFEVNRGKVPYRVAKGVANVLCLAGNGEKPLPGQGEFNPKEDFKNSAATCYERYKAYFTCQVEDLFLQSGGPSRKWTKVTFKACENILKNCSKIQIPVLLFQADWDDFVLPQAQDTFISKIKNGTQIFVPNSKHEIYLSDDQTLALYVQQILNFIK